MKTKRNVLYEALKQCLDPYKEAILDNFDDIYHVSKEDKIADKEYEYKLSDILGFAADIAFEVEENDSERNVD